VENNHKQGHKRTKLQLEDKQKEKKEGKERKERGKREKS
jgi:hypothetical protein